MPSLYIPAGLSLVAALAAQGEFVQQYKLFFQCFCHEEDIDKTVGKSIDKRA
ncbi:hypothetical protein SPONL_2224 [uncultured Candidatus Thioglobus sp.]|nr:hypothetical protein SPONL_2224 [uncultured Candidatus Thioglobus sp.]